MPYASLLHKESADALGAYMTRNSAFLNSSALKRSSIVTLVDISYKSQLPIFTHLLHNPLLSSGLSSNRISSLLQRWEVEMIIMNLTEDFFRTLRKAPAGYPPAGYPPGGYPGPSAPVHGHGYGQSHHHHHGGSGMGGLLAGGAALAGAAYGAHHLSHGHGHGHGHFGYGGHMMGHGKFKHGKFGKHGKFKHGMFGGKHFKKWK
ncbi:hypothetical protein K1719_027838 [Acacia pycnantha]|nr:hypothetical protein K1719_027838 [Acacia pycnantha]